MSTVAPNFFARSTAYSSAARDDSLKSTGTRIRDSGFMAPPQLQLREVREQIDVGNDADGMIAFVDDRNGADALVGKKRGELRDRRRHALAHRVFLHRVPHRDVEVLATTERLERITDGSAHIAIRENADEAAAIVDDR